MNYLHTLAEPVIHRDLNSFNILLRESMNAVVADFGESRFIDRLLRQEMLTKQPGNLRWMSPEVFNQSTEYNTKADVFNFSLCIWELLSGELPFANLTPLQAAQEMALKGVRPPVSDSYPESLVALMTQCWSANPNDRPDFASIFKQINDLLLFNHVNANLASMNSLSLHSPSSSFVDGERISVAELRSNFESTSPVVGPSDIAAASSNMRPSSGKSAAGFVNHSESSASPVDPNRTLERADESLDENSPSNMFLDRGQGDFCSAAFAQDFSPDQPPASSSFMAMSNGYVCDTSQPMLLMAAQRALNHPEK